MLQREMRLCQMCKEEGGFLLYWDFVEREREKEIEYNVKYVIEQIAQDQFRIPALIFGIPFCYIFFASEKYKFLSIIELFVVWLPLRKFWFVSNWSSPPHKKREQCLCEWSARYHDITAYLRYVGPLAIRPLGSHSRCPVLGVRCVKSPTLDKIWPKFVGAILTLQANFVGLS